MNIKLMNLSFYITFILVITVFFSIAVIKNGQTIQEEDYVQVEIGIDDTVWDLAFKYIDQHTYTPAEFINWVEKNNRIDADDVQPGLIITIPVKKEELNNTMIVVADGEL